MDTMVLCINESAFLGDFFPMNTRSQIFLGVGITIGVILLLVVGGIAGAWIYKELQPEPVTRPIVIHEHVDSRGAGAVILSVKPESPAAEAGLSQGDVILEVDGEEIDSANRLANLIHSYNPGEVITLTILRSGDDMEQELKVELGEDPEESEHAYLGVRYSYPPYPHMHLPLLEDHERFMIPFPGLPEVLEDYNELKDKLHFLPGCEGDEEEICGLVIADVIEDSPAEAAGVQVGDLILSVDGNVIESVEMFLDAIRSHKPGDELSLTIFRIDEDERADLEVTLGEHPEEKGIAYLGVVVPGFYRHLEFGKGPRFPWDDFRFHFDSFLEDMETFDHSSVWG
jgi:membrane-associated protease RseP (regulator of RpoE activity)